MTMPNWQSAFDVDRFGAMDQRLEELSVQADNLKRTSEILRTASADLRRRSGKLRDRIDRLNTV